jgi:hypothetical protein
LGQYLPGCGSVFKDSFSIVKMGKFKNLRMGFHGLKAAKNSNEFGVQSSEKCVDVGSGIEIYKISSL